MNKREGKVFKPDLFDSKPQAVTNFRKELGGGCPRQGQ